MRTWRATTMVAGAAALLLAGCGDEATEAVEEPTEMVADEADEGDPAEEADGADDDGDQEDAAAATEGAGDEEGAEQDVADDAGPVEAPVDDRAIDATVHHMGLEYSIEQMVVVDLDAEASPDGQVDERSQGVELTFEVSVFNPGNDTMSPRPPISLRWDEPDTGNVVDVPGNADFRQVPGSSSSSGEILVTIPPAELEVFDDASARLILGQSGQNPALVPVGSDAELVDRFPVQQDFVGETFDVNEVLVTITAAEVRWDYGNSHVEDGVALLELTYTMENRGSGQSCSTRGEGAFALTLPSGDSIVDEGVTDRCVRGGETETDVRTGFLIDGDYAGDYTLRHERSEDQDEITFTLVEAAGSPAAERDTR